MKEWIVVACATSLIIVGQVFGWPPSNIEVVPQNPTTSDVVVITITGSWPDTCIPNASAISLDGNDIYFDVIRDYPPGTMCLTIPMGWQRTESVGPLSPDTYTIYAGLTEDPPSPPAEYIYMADFIVSDKQFVLSTKSLSVPEEATAIFTVALLNDPCGTVQATVSYQSGDLDITVQTGALLDFNSSNFSVPQPVTLAAAKDEDYLNGTTLIQVSAPNYLNANVTATESDSGSPSVLYVDIDANGSNNGRNWTNAYTNLQDALSTAALWTEVNEIRIAQGIYTPTEPNGDRDISFEITNTNINIVGGYAGFGEPDPNERNANVYKTILSGDLNSNDGPNFANNDENSYHVVQCKATATLDSLTISGGNSSTLYSGAGLYRWPSGELTMTNCIFRDNIAAYGGGIFNNATNTTLINCLLFDNCATEAGGGMYSQPGNLTLTNCTLSNNSGGGLAGDVHATYVILTNCILWNNGGTGQSSQIGNGIFTINYSCIQGWVGNLGGTGNFDADPCFVDATNGDYHLQWYSPCINAGDPNGDYSGQKDIDGQDRVMYGNVDIGADEALSPCVSCVGDLDANSVVNLKDLNQLVGDLTAAKLVSGWDQWLITRTDPCEGIYWKNCADVDVDDDIDLQDLNRLIGNLTWEKIMVGNWYYPCGTYDP